MADQQDKAIDPALYAMVAGLVKRSGSSFYWGMRLLSLPRRYGMYAVYAFCRVVDDIADDPGEPEAKRQALALWRDEIAALYAGRPTDPVAVALAGPVAHFNLQQEDFLAVIDGCEMDGRNEMVRPSLDNLLLYCDRVASAVGRLSVRVFGDFQPRCLDVADALGKALQLTNILRDVREDALIGRLYLPDEVLSRHGITSSDPLEVAAHPALPEVCRDIAEMARRYYAEADRAMAECSPGAMRPARMMEAMYRAVFDRCEAAGWRLGDKRVRVPTPVKLWFILRYGLL
jgi:phytoene synthase